MKQKYTLTVANSQIDIITEENKETIDSVVGIVDRKIREVYLHSKGECSRTNAAILVCLDYCAEKLELQKTLKNLTSELERLNAINELAEREKAALEREIQLLRETIKSSTSHRAPSKKVPDEQIAFDDISEAEPYDDIFIDAHAGVTTNLDDILSGKAPITQEEKPLEIKEEKPHVRLKKKKVRAMFDNIAFDDI